MLEFAEEEIVLSSGPRAGQTYSSDFMPWSRELLEAMGSDRWRRFFLSGPVQGGKTLHGFVIPIMYHLFELEETVIIGVPDVALGQGIVEERLLPNIRVSRYASLIPEMGAGSRGGRFTAIRFGNGVWLRIMGAGGGDEQRSAHTARIVVLTEIDKMDEPGPTSREADPVTQIEARTRAFGSRARIYAECTMSVREGRVYREAVEHGTGHVVLLRCPHCRAWVEPVRERLGGWREAETVMAAREAAHYACDACGVAWDEKDRAEALRTPRLCGDGQTVSPAGKVVGPEKATNTFGFRWNAMASPLLDMADIAEQEWRAARTNSPVDQRAILQFIWALPTEEASSTSGITREVIYAASVAGIRRGYVPPDFSGPLTGFVDVGLHDCWWAVCAWEPVPEARDYRGLVVDYGAIRIGQRGVVKLQPHDVYQALAGWRDGLGGWEMPDGARRGADLWLIDAGWEGDAIAYPYVRAQGQPGTLAAKGFGETTTAKRKWQEPKANVKGVVAAPQWGATRLKRQGTILTLVTHNADHWKRWVHRALQAPADGAGSLRLFAGGQREHRELAGHILAEREEEEFTPGKGPKVTWRRLSPENHWLDCLAGCRLGVEILGGRRRDVPASLAMEKAHKGGQPAVAAMGMGGRGYRAGAPDGRTRWRVGR